MRPNRDKSNDRRKAYMRYVIDYLRNNPAILLRHNIRSVEILIAREKNFKSFTSNDASYNKSFKKAFDGVTLPSDDTLSAIAIAFEIPVEFGNFEFEIVNNNNPDYTKYLESDTGNIDNHEKSEIAEITSTDLTKEPRKPNRFKIVVVLLIIAGLVSFILLLWYYTGRSPNPQAPTTTITDSTIILKNEKATGVLVSLLNTTIRNYAIDSQAIHECLNQGADTNIRAENGRTILHVAAMLNDTVLASIALQNRNVDVNAVDKMFEATPLWYAAKFNSFQVAQLLLKRNDIILNIRAKAKGNFSTPLDNATDTAMFRLLANRGALKLSQLSSNDKIPPRNNITAEFEAQVLKDKMKNDSLIYKRNTAATNSLKRLLDLKYDNEIVMRIHSCIDSGANINTQSINKRCALHVAAICNDSLLAKKILKIDACNVNLRDYSYATPIWYAARYNSLSVARLLMEHGGVKINIRALSQYGNYSTPLDNAQSKEMKYILWTDTAKTYDQIKAERPKSR